MKRIQIYVTIFWAQVEAMYMNISPIIQGHLFTLRWVFKILATMAVSCMVCIKLISANIVVSPIFMEG